MKNTSTLCEQDADPLNVAEGDTLITTAQKLTSLFVVFWSYNFSKILFFPEIN
jgi:hypothetical protein